MAAVLRSFEVVTRECQEERRLQQFTGARKFGPDLSADCRPFGEPFSDETGQIAVRDGKQAEAAVAREHAEIKIGWFGSRQHPATPTVEAAIVEHPEQVGQTVLIDTIDI